MSIAFFVWTILTGALPAQTTDTTLDTTRWNIASHLYLLSWGPYKQAQMESNIDYAVSLGFNAIRFNVWWHEIYPDTNAIHNGGNWYPLDHTLDYAINKGLKVIITLSLRQTSKQGVILPEDRVADATGKEDANWDGATRMTYSSPRFGQVIRFVQEVGERYVHLQNAGHILAIAPLVTREAEIPYAHDAMEDGNPQFVSEFRSWLALRYEHNVTNLNTAWKTRYSNFDDVTPPKDFKRGIGRDWYLFRDLKARQFIDSCCAALADIPDLTTPYRVLLDYGNVGDPMAWKRGSLSFEFHAQNPMVWGVKQNDAHDYDQDYTGSLLGSNMRRLGKLCFNEWFYDTKPDKYPHHDIINDSYREIIAHYDQGMNGVSYVGVYPGNTNLETIVAMLKTNGVWDAPVTPRRTNDVTTVHVPLSEILPLRDWQLKKRYFDANKTGTPPMVDLLIDCDLEAELLPIIRPMK